MTYTVGSYLAARLSQIGLKHHFAVAGDFNLVLLDQLLTNKDLEQVYCCNELNCGYSAEGYARACGAAAAVVTFSVGGLSAINAIGSAYAENLPVILVSGAPNTNDRATEHLVHHTLATHDWSYQLEIVKKLTCAAVAITSAADAPHQIDAAIRAALREKKPAYIDIACNIAAAPCAAPGPVSAVVAEEPSDPETLEAAIVMAAEFLHSKQKPILLIGSKLRAAGAEKQAIELAEALGCAVTVMAAAKSFFPEDHPQFAGIYWGEISAPGAREIVDWSDADTTVIAETGDSWFNGMGIKLPGGARFEIEMQWGSIGWSVPATFGYAVGAPGRRVIALIGDGSFQLTAQEVAQMIRRKLPVIIFLINNHGYTIEVEIHDGPYNNIKNWDYAGLIQAFNAEDGRGRGMRATNAGELAEAIEVALANHEGPTLIECIADRDDASPDLISWGRQVAKANARPPRPQ